MTKQLYKRELSDEEFFRRSSVLINQYADIMKSGFPEKELASWNEKVDKLPPTAAEVIRDEVEISRSLRDALMGRDGPGGRKWGDDDPKGVILHR